MLISIIQEGPNELFILGGCTVYYNSRKIKNGTKDGTMTTTSRETKSAKKRIIEIGTKAVDKPVEIPFNSEYVLDENMEYGKTEEVIAGVKGTKTITSTFTRILGRLNKRNSSSANQ